VTGADAARAALGASLEALSRDLLARIGATRVTVRVDWAACGWDVNDVAAEALAPGAGSLKGITGIPQRAAATAQFLERERRILVQNDFSDPDLSPPQALIDGYGVRAQMLGPLVRGGALIGWISVHHAGGARQWRPADVSALGDAMAVALRVLETPVVSRN